MTLARFLAIIIACTTYPHFQAASLASERDESITETTIKRYLRLDIDAQPIFFGTPMEECIKRAIDTNKPFLVEPIKRMNANLQRLKADWPANFEQWKKEVLERTIVDKMP